MRDNPLLIRALRKIYPRENPWIVVKLIKLFWPFLFILAKITRIPILGTSLGRLLFSKQDKLLYVPKKDSITQREVVSIHEPLEQPKNIVLPSKIVKHFIKQAHKYFIMDFCICRESNQCKDYPIHLGCLFLGEAVEELPPQLGRQVTEKEALTHIKNCANAGLVHLVGRHRIDSIWLNATPEEKLLTICNCCPCCCLHRTLPHLDSQLRQKVRKLPGVQVQVTDDCIKCSSCVETCFVDAITLTKDKAVIGDACRGCGRCVQECPENAIKLSITRPEYLQQSIEEINQIIDLS